MRPHLPSTAPPVHEARLDVQAALYTLLGDEPLAADVAYAVGRLRAAEARLTEIIEGGGR